VLAISDTAHLFNEPGNDPFKCLQNNLRKTVAIHTERMFAFKKQGNKKKARDTF